MGIGISTSSLYPLETEKSLETLAKLGVKKLEIFLNSTTEATDYLDKMLEIKRSFDLDIISFHPFSSPMETVFLFSKYKRRVQEMLDLYESYFEVMNKLGAKIFIIHGAISSSSCSNDYYIEQYSLLYRIGQKYGITVAQENVSYCKSSSLDLLRQMKAELGNEVAFVVDLKQAIRSGISAFDLVDALSNKIVHFHVSDNGAKGDCLLAGKGEFDFQLLFKKAKDFGYQGDYIIELYRNNYDTYQDLIENMKYLDNILHK